MGQLAASIAHEVSQPIAATVTKPIAACAGLAPASRAGRRPVALRSDHQGRPIAPARSSAGIRASSGRCRRGTIHWTFNEAILDVIGLTRNELLRKSASLRTRLAKGLPLIGAIAIQLQQVILNLIMNAAEASDLGEASDVISNRQMDNSNGVRVEMGFGTGTERGDSRAPVDPF